MSKELRNRNLKFFLIVFFIFILIIGSLTWLYSNINPFKQTNHGDIPPGCRSNPIIPIPNAGGCFGKSLILNLSVSLDIPCLYIVVNNCNGGIIGISNSCNEILDIGGIKIYSGSRYVGLDVSEKINGTYLFGETEGNFANYIPENNEFIEISGNIGDDNITISFVKTKQLC